MYVSTILFINLYLHVTDFRMKINPKVDIWDRATLSDDFFYKQNVLALLLVVWLLIYCYSYHLSFYMTIKNHVVNTLIRILFYTVKTHV